MGFSIRVMERKDVAAVSHLLENVFGEKSPIFPNWSETLEWLYFSSEIKDPVPRALVIVNDHSIVGHIGLTVSEFTDGVRSFKVVQTGNWVVDPDHKTGLLSLRLMLEAASLGDVAVIVDGSPDAQRVIPGIGYKKHREIGRYIKIMKPWPFLRLARSKEQFLRNLGKLVIFLARSLSGRFQTLVKTNGLAHHAPLKRKVLRNTLRPEFVNWYKQCPRGDVHVLRFSSGDAIIGQATLIIQSRKGTRYANILNVDVSTEDESAWINILDTVEDFLRDKEVTHVNAIGTYEPWCRALKYKGYGRLKNMILWLRDKTGQLVDVQEWHLTAIEGDLGYLFE